jgi:hypothetical protein
VYGWSRGRGQDARCNKPSGVRREAFIERPTQKIRGANTDKEIEEETEEEDKEAEENIPE